MRRVSCVLFLLAIFVACGSTMGTKEKVECCPIGADPCSGGGGSKKGGVCTNNACDCLMVDGKDVDENGCPILRWHSTYPNCGNQGRIDSGPDAMDAMTDAANDASDGGDGD